MDWGKELETKFNEYGLVDISTLDNTIIVDLQYATSNNFINENVYGNLDKAYFHPTIAKKLVKAQQLLKQKDSRYSIIIYDAARPQSIQKKMYETVKGTPNQKYVANPSRGGHHNYGVAADVSITFDGKPVDMGTPFDSFDEMSHITNELFYVNSKKMTREAYNNRKLLRSVMRQAGFTTIRNEWWHFNGCSKEYMRANYKLLNF